MRLQILKKFRYVVGASVLLVSISLAHAHHYTEEQSNALRSALSDNTIIGCARYVRDDTKLSPNYRVHFAHVTGAQADEIVGEKVHKAGNYMLIMWEEDEITPFFLGDYQKVINPQVWKTHDIFGRTWFVSESDDKCQDSSKIEPQHDEYQE